MTWLVVLNLFKALLGLPPAQFKLFMDSVIWAIKHTMRDIADMGLNSTTHTIFLLLLLTLSRS